MRDDIIELAVSVVSIPIMFMNIVGALVGWIWLMFYGEWKLIGIGLAATFVSHYILSLVIMIVSMPFGLIAVAAIKRHWRLLGKAFGFLSVGLVCTVQVLYGILAIYVVLSFYLGNEDASIVPYMLAAWSLGISPWQFLASKEQDNEFTALSFLSFCVFYLLTITTIMFFRDYALIVAGIGVLVHVLIVPFISVKYGLAGGAEELAHSSDHYSTTEIIDNPHSVEHDVLEENSNSESLHTQSKGSVASTSVVKIGDQVWTDRNLAVKHFRNGDRIRQSHSKDEWEKLSSSGMPTWAYSRFDSNREGVRGLMYNGYAVSDPRGLAPEGFRIPSMYDYRKLVEFLGGEEEAASKLRATEHWGADYYGRNDTGSNVSGFAAIPGSDLINTDNTTEVENAFEAWTVEGNQVWIFSGEDIVVEEPGLPRFAGVLRCISEG